MLNASPLEKYMIIYHIISNDETLSENEYAITIKNYCDSFCVPCFLQNNIISNQNDTALHTSNLVYIDDNKHNVHGLFMSDCFFDRAGYLGKNEPHFNTFLISPENIDSINIQNSRVQAVDFSEIYYTNNPNSSDFVLLAKALKTTPETLCKQKRTNLNIKTMKALFDVFVQVFGGNSQTILSNFETRKNLLFATPENSSLENILQTAKKLIGTPIAKDKSLKTFDCASFLTYVFMSSAGINIAQNGFGNSLTGKIMTSNIGTNILINENDSLENKIKFLKSTANPGDILLFHRQSKNDYQTTESNWYPGHVGIYVGDGFYVDARHRRGNIALVDTKQDEYMDCFVGIKTQIFKEPSSKTNSIQMQ